MSEASIDEVYRRFAAMYANSEPIRRKDELAAAVAAGGVDLDGVDDEWLRSLPREWIYGESDEPFTDPRVNREYRRLVSELS